MNVTKLLPMMLAITALMGSADFADAQTQQLDVSRKLSLAAARGELTHDQISSLQEQIKMAERKGSASSRDQELAAIAIRIDRARRPRRTASRFLGWF